MAKESHWVARFLWTAEMIAGKEFPIMRATALAMASVEKGNEETEEVMVTAAGIAGDEASFTEAVKVDKLLFLECWLTMTIKVQTHFYKSKQGTAKNLLRKEPKPQTVNQMQPNSFEEKQTAPDTNGEKTAKKF